MDLNCGIRMVNYIVMMVLLLSIEMDHNFGKNGPAIIYRSDSQRWYGPEGENHRDNGPSVIYNNGVQFWYKDGIPQWII